MQHTKQGSNTCLSGGDVKPQLNVSVYKADSDQADSTVESPCVHTTNVRQKVEGTHLRSGPGRQCSRRTSPGLPSLQRHPCSLAFPSTPFLHRCPHSPLFLLGPSPSLLEYNHNHEYIFSVEFLISPISF